MWKKILLVLVLLAVVGGGAFWFLSQSLFKAEIQTRLRDVFDHADGFRSGYPVQEYQLYAFFDEEHYDASAPSPGEWVGRWYDENTDPGYGRVLDTVTLVKGTKKEAEVQFVLQEGFMGDKDQNLPPKLSPSTYRAVLVYSDAKKVWLLRSLKEAGAKR